MTPLSLDALNIAFSLMCLAVITVRRYTEYKRAAPSIAVIEETLIHVQKHTDLLTSALSLHFDMLISLNLSIQGHTFLTRPLGCHVMKPDA